MTAELDDAHEHNANLEKLVVDGCVAQRGRAANELRLHDLHDADHPSVAWLLSRMNGYAKAYNIEGPSDFDRLALLFVHPRNPKSGNFLLEQYVCTSKHISSHCYGKQAFRTEQPCAGRTRIMETHKKRRLHDFGKKTRKKNAPRASFGWTFSGHCPHRTSRRRETPYPGIHLRKRTTQRNRRDE